MACNWCVVRQFDVIVTDNLFGDMLSDVASMLTGSLGMLPSASLGPADGSVVVCFMSRCMAPRRILRGRVGQPLAMIQSYAMMLRYSFDMSEDADLVERAVRNVLDSGLRTSDIMQTDMTVSCEQMGRRS